ncbi:hypothetical protein ACLKA6_002636 [Drosophila palustris]
MATGQRCGSQKDPLATLAGQKEITWQHCGSQKDPLATLAGQREITWQRCGSQKDPLATLACKRVGNIAGSRKGSAPAPTESAYRALLRLNGHSSAPALLESAYRALLRSNNSDPSSAPAPTESAYRALLRLNGHSSAPALTQSACGAWLPPQRPPLLHIHHVLVGSGDVCFTTCTREEEEVWTQAQRRLQIVF